MEYYAAIKKVKMLSPSIHMGRARKWAGVKGSNISVLHMHKESLEGITRKYYR